MLTNWMSICLYSFLKVNDSKGFSLTRRSNLTSCVINWPNLEIIRG